MKTDPEIEIIRDFKTVLRIALQTIDELKHQLKEKDAIIDSLKKGQTP